MSKTQALHKPVDYVPVKIYTKENPDKAETGFWDSFDNVWCYSDSGIEILETVGFWEEIPVEA